MSSKPGAAGVGAPDLNSSSFRPVTLAAGSHDVDAGALVLTPTRPGRFDRIQEARLKGAWRSVDHTKLYGQPAPQWNAVDARGIPKGAQVADFKGKWVLVYFWGPWCRPCLGRHLPALMEFYEAHKKERDRFEIVTVCNTEPDIKTMADLDRELQPVVKSVWHKPLPFPIVLDNTLITTENLRSGRGQAPLRPRGPPCSRRRDNARRKTQADRSPTAPNEVGPKP